MKRVISQQSFPIGIDTGRCLRQLNYNANPVLTLLKSREEKRPDQLSAVLKPTPIDSERYTDD